MLRILCLCLGAICLAPAANAATVNVTFSYGGETGTLALELVTPPVAQYDPGELYLADPTNYDPEDRPTNADTIHRYDYTQNSVVVGGLSWVLRRPIGIAVVDPFAYISGEDAFLTGVLAPGASVTVFGYLLGTNADFSMIRAINAYAWNCDDDARCTLVPGSAVRATVAGGDVSAVPVPPALALMLTGAGALGFLRRRRRSHA